MNFFNSSITLLFDLLLHPLERLPSVYGLCFISLLSGLMLVGIFGWVSNQRQLKKAKEKIKAYILEMLLYRDDVRIFLKAQFKIFKQTFVCLRYVLIPFIILTIPCLIVFAQVDLRYSGRSFKVGEESIVSIHLKKKAVLDEFSISVTDGLKVLTPPLRIKTKSEINWRIRTLKEGVQHVSILNEGRRYDAKIFVNQKDVKLVKGRYQNWFGFLFRPGEERLGSESKIKAIKIRYPRVSYKIFNFQVQWFAIFFAVSLLGGLVFKKILRIEI